MTSSVAAQGRIDFADLGSERRYRFIAAYSRSKLANLMFAVELDRRAKAAGLTLVSTAVNPGIVATSLLSQKRSQRGRGARPAELAVAAIQRGYGQPPGDGCLTSLYAATAAELRGGGTSSPAAVVGGAAPRRRPSPAAGTRPGNRPPALGSVGRPDGSQLRRPRRRHVQPEPLAMVTCG